MGGGVSEDDACYFGETNSYETLSCFQYLNGNDCGNFYPDDNAAGICNATSQRYRICNTPENATDACAPMDILTVADCASKVEQLIEEGVCDESGMFYSSLCLEDPERPSCVCHYAGSVVGDYTDTGHGNSVYVLTTSSTTAMPSADPSSSPITSSPTLDPTVDPNGNSASSISVMIAFAVAAMGVTV